ncbi:hypothetical protein X975_18585, partial [Stegodyphus mimosarum]
MEGNPLIGINVQIESVHLDHRSAFWGIFWNVWIVRWLESQWCVVIFVFNFDIHVKPRSQWNSSSVLSNNSQPIAKTSFSVQNSSSAYIT